MDTRASQGLIKDLVELVLELTSIGDTVKSYRKDCASLTRRVKVLAPLFEEVRETGAPLPDDSILPFRAIHSVLVRAKDLLQECRDGSQFALILDRERVALRFRQLTADMSRALDGLPLGSLDVSDEVHEQVELVRAQLKRAKGRVDLQDEPLYLAVNTLLKKEAHGISGDNPVVQNLLEKLHLQTENAWRQELKALEVRRDVVGSRSEEECLDSMINILKKIHVSVDDERDNESVFDVWRAQKASSSTESECSQGGPVPPDDFKCPISLELMKDPVIVATGQTYERLCIQKWFDANHNTCPKTQQHLSHLVLTPNYVLRSLIAQWCESNGIEVPQRPGNGRIGKYSGNGNGSSVGGGDVVLVESLLLKLVDDHVEIQRAAAAELRLLAKVSTDNRLCIAELGAIPILVSLLSRPDPKTQEHVVTTLLNLSIHESNKWAIVSAGAIEPIVEVLKHGSMEARENSAATLFSLSAVDEHKATIGASGAIPALVVLLREGHSRGKKDAATALFNLSIYQGNKAKAVRTGIVPPLMDLLSDTSLGMVDEALAILAVLATHQEGRLAIGRANPVPVLVDLIKNGSPQNKENGASLLLALCTSNSIHTTTARQCGAVVPLTALFHSGTSRAKRKALEILQHMNELDVKSSSRVPGSRIR